MSKKTYNKFPDDFTCVDSILRVFASSPDSNLLLKERKLVKDGLWEGYEGLTKEGRKACGRLHRFLRGISNLTDTKMDVDSIIDKLDEIAAGVE